MEKETKSRIFDFVLSYLKRHNKEQLNFSLISKETGISRTTIYSYYNHIQELFEDILDCYVKPFEEKIRIHMENIHDVFSCYESSKKILEHVYRNKSFFLVEDKIKHGISRSYFTDDMKQKMIEKSNDQTKKEYIDRYYFMGLVNIIDSWKKEDLNYDGLDGCAKSMTFYAYSLLKEN